MSEDDDDFWQELSMRRARLLSAVMGTAEAELEDGLSVSVPAHGGATEDVRMLRVRLLNCIGDRQIAEQLRTAGTMSVCHDCMGPAIASVGAVLGTHPARAAGGNERRCVAGAPGALSGPQGERGTEKVRRDPGTPAMEGRRASI